jgi:hypothetical protein
MRPPVKILSRLSIRSVLLAYGPAFLLAISNLSVAFAADFPGAGHKFIADFKKLRFEQVYPSATALTWTTLNPDGSRGESGTVSIQTQQIADSVFMVSWQEANKATVVQIQDYAQKIIYTNLTLPDGSFIQLKGSFNPSS